MSVHESGGTGISNDIYIHSSITHLSFLACVSVKAKKIPLPSQVNLVPVTPKTGV